MPTYFVSGGTLIEDTYLDSQYPHANYGTATNLYLGEPSTSIKYNFLINFNFSNVSGAPYMIVIDPNTFILKFNIPGSYTVSNYHPLKFREILVPWSASGATWNSSGLENWASGGCLSNGVDRSSIETVIPSGIPAVTNTSPVKPFTVSGSNALEIIKSIEGRVLYNSDKKYGWQFYGVTGTRVSVRICSANFTTTSARPSLTFNYSTVDLGSQGRLKGTKIW